MSPVLPPPAYRPWPRPRHVWASPCWQSTLSTCDGQRTQLGHGSTIDTCRLEGCGVTMPTALPARSPAAPQPLKMFSVQTTGVKKKCVPVIGGDDVWLQQAIQSVSGGRHYAGTQRYLPADMRASQCKHVRLPSHRNGLPCSLQLRSTRNSSSPIQAVTSDQTITHHRCRIVRYYLTHMDNWTARKREGAPASTGCPAAQAAAAVAAPECRRAGAAAASTAADWLPAERLHKSGTARVHYKQFASLLAQAFTLMQPKKGKPTGGAGGVRLSALRSGQHGYPL